MNGNDIRRLASWLDLDRWNVPRWELSGFRGITTPGNIRHLGSQQIAKLRIVNVSAAPLGKTAFNGGDEVNREVIAF